MTRLTQSFLQELRSGAVLAPMAGVTDMPFRRLCLEMGAVYGVTEMVSAKGYQMNGDTLRAAREFFPGRRIWAVWQPHTFSRTRGLLDEFAGSFDDADEVIITDIFAARETYNGFGIPEVMAAMRHPSVRHLGSNADVADFLCRELREGDVVVTLSAGDANLAAPMALERMKHAAA